MNKLDFACSRCGAAEGQPCIYATGHALLQRTVPHEVRGRVVSTAPTPAPDGAENRVGDLPSAVSDVADTATPLRLACGHVASVFETHLRYGPEKWCSFCAKWTEEAAAS